VSRAVPDPGPRTGSPGEVLRRYGLRPKKSWGQCFLHDPSVVARIADDALVDRDDTVIEIGAGLGTLTAALAARARRVIAIERDRELVVVLRAELGHLSHVEVREENALTFDFAAIGAAVVVGNLPYNIASPLIFHLLEQRAAIRRATLMVQLELAQRLAAPPGSRTYGVPSVLCQFAAQTSVRFIVRSGAFVPRPRVDSAVVRLEMRDRSPIAVEEQALRDLVHAAFRFRRKTLRRALAASYPAEAVTRALLAAGVDGARRAESLNLEEFGAIACALGSEPT
jgi:16S rRNA (adenine1518-N6/adenine1519-N6)-dimethyltransferase